MERFVALFDLHWGYERKGGHKVPIHDLSALGVAIQFIEDFHPHHVILGGDILDCLSISHHTAAKPGQREGLRLLEDAQGLRRALIDPIEASTSHRVVYHYGNHEDWLLDLIDIIPALEGIVEPEHLLHLGKRWEVVPLGGSSRLGKIHFIHGDTVRGGTNPALAAVTAYERNIRFGHFHTFQAATKTTPVDANGHTGIAVPCLCRNGLRYGGGAPNKWVQGFLYGYVGCVDHTFNDFVPIIVNGRATIEGHTYTG